MTWISWWNATKNSSGILKSLSIYMHVYTYGELNCQSVHIAHIVY